MEQLEQQIVCSVGLWVFSFGQEAIQVQGRKRPKRNKGRKRRERAAARIAGEGDLGGECWAEDDEVGKLKI